MPADLCKLCCTCIWKQRIETDSRVLTFNWLSTRECWLSATIVILSPASYVRISGGPIILHFFNLHVHVHHVYTCRLKEFGHSCDLHWLPMWKNSRIFAKLNVSLFYANFRDVIVTFAMLIIVITICFAKFHLVGFHLLHVKCLLLFI